MGPTSASHEVLVGMSKPCACGGVVRGRVRVRVRVGVWVRARVRRGGWEWQGLGCSIATRAASDPILPYP